MKTSERFNRAYNALHRAFYKEQLLPGHCSACAVGNIVAGPRDSIKLLRFMQHGEDGEASYPHYKLVDKKTGEVLDTTYWKSLFMSTTDEFRGGKVYQMKWYANLQSQPEADRINKYSEKLYIDTGYKADELAKVEFAFEEASIKVARKLAAKYEIAPGTTITSAMDSFTKEDNQEIQYAGLCAVIDVLLSFEKGTIDATPYQTKLKTEYHESTN